MPQVNDYAAFILTGEARAAAVQLLVLEHELIKKHRFFKNNPAPVLKPIESGILKQDVREGLRKARPDLVAALGLDRSVVQITQRDGGLPRAYEHFPHVAMSVYDGEIVDVVMFCPVDYRGFHHTPVNALSIPAGDIKVTDFGERILLDRFHLSQPSLSMPERGTKTPADFDPAAHKATRSGDLNGYAPKVFIAGGSSLSCVEDSFRHEGRGGLSAYWQLWNPTAPKNLRSPFNDAAENVRSPKLDTVRGVHYLIYLVDPQAPVDHCNPPGGIPVSTAEYLWMKDDIADEARGVRPAEPPSQFAHLRPYRLAHS